jgi:hypothetical protein
MTPPTGSPTPSTPASSELPVKAHFATGGRMTSVLGGRGGDGYLGNCPRWPVS